ncbi:MAG: ATP-dependent RecD-like DNA helicase [Deltaproteobacteria bacterium]|nr:MAG: ATP-dependent RecD-like DNA helicase [Deltaproteobacteria bacterium]
MTTIEGHLEKITYYNAESLYTIAKLKTEKNRIPVTIVGYLPQPNPGETLRISGIWETHPRYGQQFRLVSYEVILPATVAEIKAYLEAGFIKGVGPKTVSRIVEHFKSKALEIIEKKPEKLAEVKGIGKDTATRIHKAWKEHHAARALMQFLQENGVKAAWSSKIIKTYGVDALEVLRNDPYRLANDIPRIGFFIADTIARRTGAILNDSERAKACVMHLLQNFAEAGNIFIYEDQAIYRCEHLFQLAWEDTRQAIQSLVESKELIIEAVGDDPNNRGIFLKPLYQAEVGIAHRLKALLSNPVRDPELDPDQLASEVLKKLAIKLSSEQIGVLQGIFSHRLAIITGGPGTGKTTLIRAIAAVVEALGKKVLLTAPTGRAARRLSQITGGKTATIHRLLRYNPIGKSFERNQNNPLGGDTVIVDEASMVDTPLMYHLLNAIWVGASLILVGDVFQLPSVGPGNMLADLIGSKIIKTYELKEIFRQTHESPIVINAHKVRRGEFPDIKKSAVGDELSEFYFIEQNHPDTVVNIIVELCTRKIPQYFAIDPVDDIQVLSPMHKGTVGTYNLNQVLQETLNPNPDMIRVMENRFKLGDKVMHLKNNYQKEVFNGDIGRISEIDRKNGTLSVNYDDRIVSYDFSETDEIALAYAISVHKSQGSEYPAVIIPLMTQHYALLYRNLLYTAITRGKKLVILIGMHKALAMALKNDMPGQRLSSLASRLMMS